MNLESALNRQSPIQLQLAVSKSKGYKLANEIIAQIASEWGLTYDDVVGKRRLKTFVRCRREVAYTLRYSFSLSLTEVGIIMDRDHTTIMNLLRGRESENAHCGN